MHEGTPRIIHEGTFCPSLIYTLEVRRVSVIRGRPVSYAVPYTLFQRHLCISDIQRATISLRVAGKFAKRHQSSRRNFIPDDSERAILRIANSRLGWESVRRTNDSRILFYVLKRCLSRSIFTTLLNLVECEDRMFGAERLGNLVFEFLKI